MHPHIRLRVPLTVTSSGRRFAMIADFSTESGKITRVSHYLDTEVEFALYAAHGV